MPLIGISACHKIEDYRQSVLHAGGEVRVLEPPADGMVSLGDVQGLLLTGGSDVAPARYGETPHPTVVDVDPARDEFELALIVEARRRRLPMLAICRGIQILNVAFGGTLVQDIASQLPGSLQHRLPAPPHMSYDLAHELWLEKGTLLERLMRERLSDTDTCQVNSRHHQAIGRVGVGLVVSATAPDGVIEALEDPGATFCLGVQWHPENFWRTGEFRPLFEGFLEAAIS
jgi:putative glutamine amidotransferase